MKKIIILSLIGIITLTAYGGFNTKVFKEKSSVSYSINDQADVNAGYVVADLPQASAREMSIDEIRFKTYGAEVLLASRRLNWQDRSDRLRLTHDTSYKPISKPFCKLVPMSPPKIC